MQRSILVVLLALVFCGGAYAEDGIYGCWGNLQKQAVHNPWGVMMASLGEVICFERDGVVETIHYGGGEGLGSGGKFSYEDGHLLLIRTEDLPEGWPFADEGHDRCSVSIVRDKLTIERCNGWGPSKALILDRLPKRKP